MAAVDIAELGLSVRSDGVVVATDRLDDLEKSSKKAESAAVKLSDKMSKVGKQMSDVGKSISLRVTTPLLAGAGASVKFASDFENSFADIRKTVNATEAEFEQMSLEIRELAKEVPTAVEELNRLGGVAGQLGVQQKNIIAFTRTVAMLGDTTDIAGEQAALSISRFMNVMGTAQQDIDRVGSTIVGLGNNFAAMESEIVDTATSLAAFGSQMDLTEAQVLAFATAIAASGGQTEAASTAFQKTASTMQRAVLEMNSDLRIFADTAGVTSAQFADAFRTDAAGAILLFLEGLKNVSDQGQSTAAVLEELGLADQRLQREFGKLIGNLGQLDDAIALASEEWERNTALTEEAEKRYKTFASQMAIFRNRVKDAGITLGNDLIPFVKRGTERIEELVEAFHKLSPEARMAKIRFLAYAAVIGPLVILLGSLARAIGGVILVLTKLKPVALLLFGSSGLFATAAGALRKTAIRIAGVTAALGPMAGAMAALRASMGLLFGPVGLVITAISLLPLLSSAMSDAKGDATDLDLEIQALIDSVENMGKTAFDLTFEKLGAAMEENDARIKSLNDEIDNLSKDRMLGFEFDSPMAGLLEDVTAELAEAEAEGERLEQQFRALTIAAMEVDPALQEIEVVGKRLPLVINNIANAAVNAIPPIQEFSDAVRNDLAKSFEFLEQEGDAIDLAKSLDDQATAALGEVKALREGAKAHREYRRAMFQTQQVAQLGEEVTASAARAVQELAGEQFDAMELLDVTHFVGQIEQSMTGPLVAQLESVAAAKEVLNEAFERGDLGAGLFDDMTNSLERFQATLRLTQFQEITGEWISALQEVEGLFERDSREAEQLQGVLQSLHIAMGIAAVIKQLIKGDVWTAIPRALGVAALIAKMGVNTGAAGGGMSVSASRQQAQGTGTVLGSDDKTESIANASEITATATSELVGINRGMLRALVALQAGISGATAMLARGAGEIQFREFNPKTLGELLGDPFREFNSMFDLLGLDELLGGSADIVDQGIAILGGSINDIITDVLVQAFQSVEVKKHIFDDVDLEEEFVDLGEEMAAQFSLIFASIRDTVLAAGEALGIPLDELQERIESFRIEAQRISLLDLSAEEQQAELEAVFGAIFDDLAEHVIPFIGQFQQVGEGLGETLVRVATSVQVFEEAAKQLGLAFDATDPEQVAQIAVSLVELSGGVEEFITRFTGFIDRFASDEQKLAFASDQLNRAFEQMNLELPETGAGLVDLIQSLDVTTEAGRRQIATILELEGVAAAYYKLVEEAEEARLGRIRQLRDFVNLGPPDALTQLRDSFKEAMENAQALGASTREYAMIARSFDRQMEILAANLTKRVISLTQQLFSDESRGLAGSFESDFEKVRVVSNQLFTAWKRAIEGIAGFTGSILLDDQLSPLTPAERLAEAQSQFMDLLDAALAGDVEAANQLPQAARLLLEEARFMFASGQQFRDIFDFVVSSLAGVDLPGDVAETITEAASTAHQTAIEVMQDTLSKSLDRLLLATDLASALRDLSFVLDTSVIQLADELGVPLEDLVTILGVNLKNLTHETAGALANAAELLGADVLELSEHLGVNIGELADAFGVAMDGTAQELVTSIVNFANVLGVDIDKITEALEVNLGDITDATSVLSQGLDEALAQLPPDIAEDIQPFLDAIRSATEAADSNAAIQNLGNFVQDLPPDIASNLQPFLDAIGFEPIGIEPVENLLVGIDEDTSAMRNNIWLIKNNSQAQIDLMTTTNSLLSQIRIGIRSGSVLGQFQEGGFVPQTGPYQLHAGEFVVPNSTNAGAQQPSMEEVVKELSAIRKELAEIREDAERYQRRDLDQGKQSNTEIAETRRAIQRAS